MSLDGISEAYSRISAERLAATFHGFEKAEFQNVAFAENGNSAQAVPESGYL
jgi:hypothetical protein